MAPEKKARSRPFASAGRILGTGAVHQSDNSEFESSKKKIAGESGGVSGALSSLADKKRKHGPSSSSSDDTDEDDDSSEDDDEDGIYAHEHRVAALTFGLDSKAIRQASKSVRITGQDEEEASEEDENHEGHSMDRDRSGDVFSQKYDQGRALGEEAK